MVSSCLDLVGTDENFDTAKLDTAEMSQYNMKQTTMGGVDAAVASFEKTIDYSSNFAKLWHISIAFRIMITILIGSALYANHETTFKCATTQHLCNDVCFNQFMPINHTRYWQIQAVFLGLVAFGFAWVIEHDSRETGKFSDSGIDQYDNRTLWPEGTGWGRLYKSKVMKGNLVPISKRVHICHYVHLLMLAIVDGAFLMGFIFLLKQQHDPGRSLMQLVLDGDISFTPPIYVCNISRTFTPEQETRYRIDKKFRSTLAGLRIKAETACDQTDSVCTISKYSEKTFITRAMVTANMLGCIVLVLEMARKICKGRKRDMANPSRLRETEIR